MVRLCAIVTACAIASPALADGYYYEQTVGLSSGRGANAAPLAMSLRVRAGVGMRRGPISIEPWVSADLTLDREGSTLEVFGGAPAMDHADLSGTGVDVKYIYDLPRGVSLYVRGGPRFASGDGALGGSEGPGLGTGTGVQLSGNVRALGFLWAPLFFVPRGPFAVGAVFLDESVDMYWLTASPRGARAVPIVATNVGFAIGTAF
jgi:hypothetical protein